MKDSGKGSDSINFIGREERVRTGEDTFLGIKNLGDYNILIQIQSFRGRDRGPEGFIVHPCTLIYSIVASMNQCVFGVHFQLRSSLASIGVFQISKN